ncbi:MAG: hypothetical protein Kow0059_01700 [Candidatus Sumerlaeia bacterium]
MQALFPSGQWARLLAAVILMGVVMAASGFLIYRFASHDPDYEAILAALEGRDDPEDEDAPDQSPARSKIPDFRWPCAGEISSLFGERVHPISGKRSRHTGIDIAAPYYEPVYAAASGTVTWAARSGGKGNLVVIRHNDVYSTQYFHLQKIKVRKGEQVLQGDLIGWVGSTGYSNGPHLHLEVHKRGVPVDPANYLPPPAEERLARLKREGIDYPIGGD